MATLSIFAILSHNIYLLDSYDVLFEALERCAVVNELHPISKREYLKCYGWCCDPILLNTINTNPPE